MTVKDMVKKYLETNGFDGLCCEDCGCGLDDLMACGETYNDCKAAYKRIVTKEEFEDMNFDLGYGCEIGDEFFALEKQKAVK